MSSTLDDILAAFKALPEDKQQSVAKEAAASTASMKWIPNPGPQTDAYFSPADVLLYGGQGGGGKALALDTPIPTPDGWTTMVGIGVGDTVFDKDGKPCRVVATTPVMIGRTCHRVRFSDGAEIIADADHQWLTLTLKDRNRLLRASPEWRAKRRAARAPRAGQGVRTRPDLAARNAARNYDCALPEASIRTTREIAGSVYVRADKPHLNHSVPVCGPVDIQARNLAIDPYLLGAWLGDGSSRGARITMAEDEMVEHVEVAASVNGWGVTKGTSKYDYGVTGGLRVALRGYGLLGSKSVPQVYLRGSFDQRLALLQGMMDTDGFAKPSGGCEFTTTSPALRDGILELLWSLGVQATCTTGRAMLKGRDCGAKYRVKFTTHLPAFRLERKLERQRAAKLRSTIYSRYIESADLVESVPVRCIEVDSPSHTYLCGRQMIPTHNSDLGLGLAFIAHERSLILRREYANLGALTDRTISIHGSRSGYNGSPPPKLRFDRDGKECLIAFGANQHLGDEQAWQGQAFDFKYFDEATQFLEIQIRFHLGWIRSTTPGQRTRAVLGTNPPINSDGDWIIGYFRPWLDLTHPKPAQHGELRYFVTAPDGTDLEVDGTGPKEIGGRTMMPMSRSFIPAKLSDNPYLINTDYQAKLDGLPEPIRSAVRDGNFMATRRDSDRQVIPTQWIIEAQARWTERAPEGQAQVAIAADIAQGGNDNTVITYRHGGWFAKQIAKPGTETPDGASVAALIIANRRDGSSIILDMGGGYGGAAAEKFDENAIPIVRFNGANASSKKTKDGSLGFVNKRAEAYWTMREELDPEQEGGSIIALPPDPELRSQLAAATYEVKTRGIQVEAKDEIKKRLGASPDKADSAVMCLAEGKRSETKQKRRAAYGTAGMPTRANSGHQGVKGYYRR